MKRMCGALFGEVCVLLLIVALSGCAASKGLAADKTSVTPVGKHDPRRDLKTALSEAGDDLNVVADDLSLVDEGDPADLGSLIADCQTMLTHAAAGKKANESIGPGTPFYLHAAFGFIKTIGAGHICLHIRSTRDATSISYYLGYITDTLTSATTELHAASVQAHA